MRKMLVRFIREDEGQDLVEYALLGGLITVVVALVITNIGNQVLTLYSNLLSAIGG
jgi:pilus assembly protein Flp/PilA